MQFHTKKFHELSLSELYEILRLRSEVFVVEQNCAYQDIDHKDQNAIHVLGYENEELITYARCFAPGIYFEEAAIGRVLVAENHRGSGHGHKIVSAAIKAIEENHKTASIRISAQEYLIDFYKKHRFEVVGEVYLEDGIPHVGMLWTRLTGPDNTTTSLQNPD